MHKWWARRLGSVFRTIALYALTDEEPGATAKPVTAQQEVMQKATCVNYAGGFSVLLRFS